MKYYHATSEKAFNSIMKEGVIKTGIDGIIYLTISREDALKFIGFRLIGQPIYMLEVELNDNDVFETFDHSYKFFKCKSYGVDKNIDVSNITNVWKYN